MPRPPFDPVYVAAAGAVCIASSGILVRLADTTPATVALFRCLYALPVLAVITVIENRKVGPLPGRSTRLAWIAGFFFTVDLILWHNAIDAVGAGLATVLGNLQVLIVGFAAWLFLRERPRTPLFVALPVMIFGVVLISGVIGKGAYGKDPVLGVVLGLGTSLAYAIFILVLREGSRDLKRVAGPLFHATLASGITTIIFGLVTSDIDWTLSLASHGWLITLALTAQCAGWLLISRSLPRLPAAITSVILLLQPVGAMILASLVLAEEPGFTQLMGAVLILGGVVVATSGRRPEVPAPATVL